MMATPPGLLKCEACGLIWHRPTSRGRKPRYCPVCTWRECEVCGEVFEATNRQIENEGRGRCCSPECTYEARRARIEWRQRDHYCKGCGEQFQPRGSDRTTYCSRGCAFTHHEQWMDTPRPKCKWPPDTETCRQCGDEYPIEGSDARFPSKCCSEECEQVWLERECEQCGDRFTAQAHNAKYCSGECRAGAVRDRAWQRWKQLRKGQSYTPRQRTEKECEGCGASFMSDSGQKFCTPRCNPSDSRGGSRFLAYVLERDGKRCQICGQVVAHTKRWPDPRSPTVDHIVPLSKGGEDTQRNVQLAHWECNGAKSDGSAGSQLLCIG